jgi:hypothetical protein
MINLDKLNEIKVSELMSNDADTLIK